MKLENSLSSRSGSLPSAIVELRHPEERMAARLIERLGINPPIDVEKICAGFADTTFKHFPIEIDGVCLDLKIPGRRPKVWVSKTIPFVRRRFTLAHEIGHIVIPWHTGTIVDDIEAPRSSEKTKYRQMEAEANRFAAELLMPSVWAVSLAERADHAAGLMQSIRDIAQVSLPTAFLKAAKVGRPGFVGAEVRDGVIVRALRTPETKSRPPEVGHLVALVEMPTAFDPVIVHGPESQFCWWQIKDTLEDSGCDLADWRTILEGILVEIPPEFRPKARASVNAIVGVAIGREPKGNSVERIYKTGLEATQNRESESMWVRHVLSHSDFKNYVLARSRERATQSKTS